MELARVLGVFALATALCVLLWYARRLPVVGAYLHAGIAAVFLYLPTALIARRGESYESYGLVWRPLGRNLAVFLVFAMAILPSFVVCSVLYYRWACAEASLARKSFAVYRRLCRRRLAWRQARLRWPPKAAQWALSQLLVVALPEEYFFRGYVQTRLDRLWPLARPRLGLRSAWGILLASVLFGLGHVAVDLNALRFAVFFPSLVFGWMRQITGSITAAVLFHASCNLVSDVLHRSLFV